MKQLTDAERLTIAVNLLSERDLATYALACEQLEHDCERNGFYNTPAECEDKECNVCAYAKEKRKLLDCPYVD